MIKYLAMVFFISIAIQLQSCGDNKDWVSVITCKWNDPFLCQKEGDIRLKNKSTSRNIVRIYLVKKCANGWGNGLSVLIGPDQSARFTRDADKKYDVKADWDDGYCDVRTNIEIPYGGEEKVTLYRNGACDINATSC